MIRTGVRAYAQLRAWQHIRSALSNVTHYILPNIVLLFYIYVLCMMFYALFERACEHFSVLVNGI